MLVNLATSSDINVKGSNNNDQFLLGNSSGDIINGGSGNDTFVVDATAGELDDTIVGGSGVNFLQLQGSDTSIDLTTGTSNIEAVVARKGLSGESVNVNLSQIAASSMQASSLGKAFAALIGPDGMVSVNEAGKFSVVGVLNAAGQGFSATGAALDSSDTAALAAEVTSIANIEGNLAADYSGSKTGTPPANESYVPGALNAYVFTDGSRYITVWTDGTLTVSSQGGAFQTTVYDPGFTAVSQPATLSTIPTFTRTETYAAGALGTNPAGLTTLHLSDGDSLAYAAVALKGGVSGTVVRGDTGADGGDWFGLGGSGGDNIVEGSPQGDIFDLQDSTSLSDILKGGAGFNVVLTSAAGADVDLTANGAAGVAASKIDAVVGNNKSGQTVEVDLNALATTKTSGVETAYFEAYLAASPNNLVTLESTSGDWIETATFGPGSPLPANATALQDASILDGLAHNPASADSAENTLTGYLFEKVTPKGAPIEYVTIYTNAALDYSQLPTPSPAVMAQAMAQLGSSSASVTASAPLAQVSSAALTLAAPSA